VMRHVRDARGRSFTKSTMTVKMARELMEAAVRRERASGGDRI